MYFLSIESSTQNFAVAVSRDDKLLRFRNIKAQKALEHSMLGVIDRILDSAKVPFKKLDAFVIGIGPGSFTSLRVGLSTVKAFALATQKHIAGICSLDVIAHGVSHLDNDEICVLIDARRNMVYSALYTKTPKGLKQKGQYRLSTLDEALDLVHGRTLFVGDALGLYRKNIEQVYAECTGTCQAVFAPTKYWFPNPESLAKLGYERLKAKRYDDPAQLVPIYLYAHDCQVDKK